MKKMAEWINSHKAFFLTVVYSLATIGVSILEYYYLPENWTFFATAFFTALFGLSLVLTIWKSKTFVGGIFLSLMAIVFANRLYENEAVVNLIPWLEGKAPPKVASAVVVGCFVIYIAVQFLRWVAAIVSSWKGPGGWIDDWGSRRRSRRHNERTSVRTDSAQQEPHENGTQTEKSETRTENGNPQGDGKRTELETLVQWVIFLIFLVMVVVIIWICVVQGGDNSKDQKWIDNLADHMLEALICVFLGMSALVLLFNFAKYISGIIFNHTDDDKEIKNGGEDNKPAGDDGKIPMQVALPIGSVLLYFANKNKDIFNLDALHRELDTPDFLAPLIFVIVAFLMIWLLMYLGRMAIFVMNNISWRKIKNKVNEEITEISEKIFGIVIVVIKDIALDTLEQVLQALVIVPDFVKAARIMVLGEDSVDNKTEPSKNERSCENCANYQEDGSEPRT